MQAMTARSMRGSLGAVASAGTTDGRPIAWGDGEDYELVFALAADADRNAFHRAWKRVFARTLLTRIGDFVRAGRLPPTAVDLAAYSGYEHLTDS